jgi:hypothetical protein
MGRYPFWRDVQRSVRGLRCSRQPSSNHPGLQEGIALLVRLIKDLGYQIALEAIAKPVFIVILNEVKDLRLLKMRDSSLRSE